MEQRILKSHLPVEQESQCSAEFEWHTSVTCACKSSPSRPSAASDKYQYMHNFSSSHAGMVASAVLIVVALLATASYFRDPENRACLRSCLNPFSSRRSAGRVQYCRVNTSEEARLLLDASDPTQCQTDSDDDLLNA
ncbi:hypothetical protein KM043_002442 [Ampulex compressa]|nr:hypothetical protein KM043_002442 [Ampulex compressa]